jgi:hypothetical protein
MAIEYRKGNVVDDLRVSGQTVLIHVVNDVGAWGAGFTKSLDCYPECESEYRNWFQGHRDTSFLIGSVHFVSLGGQRTVAHMLAQRGIGRQKQRLDYDALEMCLDRVRFKAQAYDRVIGPRFGCGLAGGKWEVIEPMVNKYLIAKGIPVTIYDLEEH